jgi:hypothetical protein
MSALAWRVLAAGWLALWITTAGVAQEARCFLKMSYTLADLPIDASKWSEVLCSSGVLDDAAREVGVAPSDVTINLGHPMNTMDREGPHQIMRLGASLSVQLAPEVPDAPAKATRVLHAMCRRLEQTLKEAGDAQREHLRQRVAAADEASQAAGKRLQAIYELQLQLSHEAGRSDLSRDALLSEVRETEHELRELDMKLVALNARETAITEQIARIGRATTQANADNPVVAELQKVVALKEEQVQRLLKEREAKKDLVALDAAVRDAQEQLALARAEVAKQSQQLAQAAGGNLLSDMNRSLLTSSVDMAEAEARRQFLRASLDQVHEKGLMSIVDRYEREVELPLPLATDAARDAERTFSELQNQLRFYAPPDVVVLGAAPDDRAKRD